MTLELTTSEFNNLIHCLSESERRQHVHPFTTSQEREDKILSMLKDQKSNRDIRRCLKTSDEVINRIKRENGLWGV